MFHIYSLVTLNQGERSNMKVNIKETLDILNNSKVIVVKRVKPKNLTFEVYKLTSFRNALKQWGK